MPVSATAPARTRRRGPLIALAVAAVSPAADDLYAEYDELLAAVVDGEGNHRYTVGDHPDLGGERGLVIDGQPCFRLKLLKPEQREPYTFQYVLRNIYPLGGTNIDFESFELRIESTDISLDNPELHEGGLDYLRLGQSGGTLSGGEAQRIKLVKELSRGGQHHTLYILDEPTTSLSAIEAERLFALLLRLKAEGRGLIYISHALSDVLRLADVVISCINLDVQREAAVARGQDRPWVRRIQVREHDVAPRLRARASLRPARRGGV